MKCVFCKTECRYKNFESGELMDMFYCPECGTRYNVKYELVYECTEITLPNGEVGSFYDAENI